MQWAPGPFNHHLPASATPAGRYAVGRVTPANVCLPTLASGCSLATAQERNCNANNDGLYENNTEDAVNIAH